MYMYVCMYVYICVCVYVCMYICVCVCVCMYVCMYVCMCVCINRHNQAFTIKTRHFSHNVIDNVSFDNHKIKIYLKQLVPYVT